MTTGALERYPAYKPSGVEWLGDVPEHWSIRRLRSILTGGNVRNRPRLPLLSVVRERGVILRDVANRDENHNFIPDDLTNYKVVTSGQFAMNKMKAWQGSYGVSQHDGIVSPAYFVFDLQDVDGAFFHMAIRSRAYVPFFGQASDGVRIGQWDLSQSRMREIPFVLPPLPVQRTIVRYLDYVDRCIRRYVDAKRKLITLLEEERQAVVNRAVTRGLDPNVRLKPSGIEWLGDVPEHWEVLRVGRFSKIGNGSTPSRGNAAYWTDGVHPWLNSSSVNQGVITRADQFVTDLALRECHLPRLHPGSVLVGITGQGKTRGMAAVLSIDATINQHMAFITPDMTRVSSHYLQMCLTAAYSELRAISDDSGSTKGALTCEDIKRFMVVLPPREEQERLVSEVRRELAGVDAAIDRARRQVELVEEYRTRLIADVVTGKLDVREAAEHLPNEAEDDTPIGESGPQQNGFFE